MLDNLTTFLAEAKGAYQGKISARALLALNEADIRGGSPGERLEYRSVEPPTWLEPRSGVTCPFCGRKNRLGRASCDGCGAPA